VGVDPLERRRAVEYLRQHGEASLETFFDSVGLGEAFRLPKSGYGRQKRINEALREAEERGDLTAVLSSAREWFERERSDWRDTPVLLREPPNVARGSPSEGLREPGSDERTGVLSDQQPDSPRYLDDATHRWAVQHRDFLAVVYEAFNEEGDWPQRGVLQRRLVREGKLIDFGQLAVELPQQLGHREAPPEERIVLRLFALRYLDEAQDLLQQFVEALKLAANRYRSDEDEPVLGRRDLTERLGMSDSDATKLSRVLLREARFLGSGTTEVTDWERQIYDQGLVRFLEVANIDDYLAVEAGLLQGRPPPSSMVNQPHQGRRVFLVHGHNEAAKQTVARFLDRITQPGVVILKEQPDRGRTIIEKFEEYAGQAGYAVILLNGDDEGRKRSDGELRPRARQNVVLELGFFIGKLGRDRVALLYEEGVELPSDISGVVYLRLDAEEAWKRPLAREMQDAGVAIDTSEALKA